MNAIYGPTNISPDQKKLLSPKRHTWAVELRPEKEAYYRQLHADVWASILARLAASHVHNYSISVATIGGRRLLVAYFEYWGGDFDADMAAIAADPETRRWWQETDPCQTPLEGCEPGQQWLRFEEVFYFDAPKA